MNRQTHWQIFQKRLTAIIRYLASCILFKDFFLLKLLVHFHWTTTIPSKQRAWGLNPDRQELPSRGEADSLKRRLLPGCRWVTPDLCCSADRRMQPVLDAYQGSRFDGLRWNWGRLCQEKILISIDFYVGPCCLLKVYRAPARYARRCKLWMAFEHSLHVWDLITW